MMRGQRGKIEAYCKIIIATSIMIQSEKGDIKGQSNECLR
jgi:hypothetical protein